MKAYLNDLSCGNKESKLTDQLDKVNKFFELLKHLNITYGLEGVIIEGSFGGLEICDTRLGECNYMYEDNFDIRNLVPQLRNYLINDLEVNPRHVFVLGDGRRSILLGNAHESSRPSVSFTFHAEFETHEIKGKKNDKDATVYNLYDKDRITDDGQPFDLANLVSKQDCKEYSPTVTPLWNKATTSAYHDSIKGKLAEIAKYPKQKIAILHECSDVIARLNGWKFDKELTNHNSNNGAFRRIYRSDKFTSGKGYLSVDFEKVDIHFELHDKRGKHKGEYRWDGTKTADTDPTGNHDIGVR
ncbi:MAG: hypothetical protein K2K49_02200 [Duncaniella sp.]|nr:hypothetical protein [Duncaniella sp.]